jgi:hypothetical protein
VCETAHAMARVDTCKRHARCARMACPDLNALHTGSDEGRQLCLGVDEHARCVERGRGLHTGESWACWRRACKAAPGAHARGRIGRARGHTGRPRRAGHAGHAALAANAGPRHDHALGRERRAAPAGPGGGQGGLRHELQPWRPHATRGNRDGEEGEGEGLTSTMNGGADESSRRTRLRTTARA